MKEISWRLFLTLNKLKLLKHLNLSLLEIRKRKSRSHGIKKKGNGKRKKRAVKRSNTSLKDLSKVLEDHGRHSMLSFLSSLPISVLRILDTEANKLLRKYSKNVTN